MGENPKYIMRVLTLSSNICVRNVLSYHKIVHEPSWNFALEFSDILPRLDRFLLKIT